MKKLGLEVVILSEKPNLNRTVIEKFEANGDTGFAVVLLTGDDVGALRPALGKEPELQPRARQNVVFELGYFIGKLGRERVCALYEAGTEKPSDYEGILYVPLDESAGWRLLLAREIKQVLDIDLNLLT